MVESTPKKWGIIAAPGYPFIGASGLLVLLGWLLSWVWLWLPGLVGLAFFAYFFRDPERKIPGEPGLIVAPADGKVIRTDEVREDRYLNAPARRVAIFMNVFDVHVNRAPLAGTIKRSEHRDGCFKAAWSDAACDFNEQQSILLDCGGGRRVLVVQIAGLLARRIIPFVGEGDHLSRGQRLGMICFGSRVDIYLPLEAEILVKKGDRVKAGESIVARWS